MIRVFLQELALFIVPFALYALLLTLQRKKVMDVEHWSRAGMTLTIIGLALAIAGLLYLGIFVETHTGTYVPPHMEDGKLVPGSFK